MGVAKEEKILFVENVMIMKDRIHRVIGNLTIVFWNTMLKGCPIGEMVFIKLAQSVHFTVAPA